MPMEQKYSINNRANNADLQVKNLGGKVNSDIQQ